MHWSCYFASTLANLLTFWEKFSERTHPISQLDSGQHKHVSQFTHFRPAFRIKGRHHKTLPTWFTGNFGLQILQGSQDSLKTHKGQRLHSCHFHARIWLLRHSSLAYLTADLEVVGQTDLTTAEKAARHLCISSIVALMMRCSSAGLLLQCL